MTLGSVGSAATPVTAPVVLPVLVPAVCPFWIGDGPTGNHCTGIELGMLPLPVTVSCLPAMVMLPSMFKLAVLATTTLLVLAVPPPDLPRPIAPVSVYVKVVGVGTELMMKVPS